MTNTIAIVFFWVAVLAILHTYVFYGVFLKLFYRFNRKKKNSIDASFQPEVYILMAAYNEESVIAQKITSVFNTNYVAEKVHLLIGSDASTDNTNNIIESFQVNQKNLHFYNAPKQGKASILNYLYHTLKEKKGIEESILILTDANVFFNTNTIAELVKPFSDKYVGQVGAYIKNSFDADTEIASSEHFYIKHENEIKFLEGENFGSMIGAFGACYAIRAHLFPTLPTHFFMEDFFISLHVLKNKHVAILNKNAVATEDLPGKAAVEYNRKTRIAQGNWQNFFYYIRIFFEVKISTTFCYISHKVLRWFTPFFIITAAISLSILKNYSTFFHVIYISYFIVRIFVLIDFILLKTIDKKIPIIRPFTYFLMMNAAMIKGMFKYFFTSPKNSSWTPTPRHV